MTELQSPFESGVPHGWIPAVGEAVYLLLSGNVIADATVTDAWERTHYPSGKIERCFSVDAPTVEIHGMTCMTNSLRPRKSGEWRCANGCQGRIEWVDGIAFCWVCGSHSQ